MINNLFCNLKGCGNQEIPGDGGWSGSEEDCSEGGSHAEKASPRASDQSHWGNACLPSCNAEADAVKLHRKLFMILMLMLVMKRLRHKHFINIIEAITHLRAIYNSMLTKLIFHSISNANLHTCLYYKDISSFTKMINSIGLWNKWFKGMPHTSTNENWEKFNYATVGTWNGPWNLICSLNSFPPTSIACTPGWPSVDFSIWNFSCLKGVGRGFFEWVQEKTKTLFSNLILNASLSYL